MKRILQVNYVWLILPRVVVLAVFDGFTVLMVCYWCYLIL